MDNFNYSKVYRIMHWSIAICTTLLLFTIFLRMTWMNKDHVADIIQNYLADKNTSLSRDELIVLAKQIRKPMWVWHIYLGYVLSGLFFIRLILPFFGEMKFRNPFQSNISAKVKFQFWVYLIFTICFTFSLITGLLIEFGPESIKHDVEELHELSIYYLVAFLILHLGGVLLAELTNQKGIVSRMISGAKNKDQ